MQLLFSFDQGMRVDETLIETFAFQLSWVDETLIGSHAVLIKTSY